MLFPEVCSWGRPLSPFCTPVFLSKSETGVVAPTTGTFSDGKILDAPTTWLRVKIKQLGQTAGFGLPFHLPGFHFGPLFLSHTHVSEARRSAGTAGVPIQPFRRANSCRARERERGADDRTPGEVLRRELPLRFETSFFAGQVKVIPG